MDQSFYRKEGIDFLQFQSQSNFYKAQKGLTVKPVELISSRKQTEIVCWT